MDKAAALYATLVLPARNGCNLKCPFCVIDRRGEATTRALTDAAYLTFVTEILRHFKVERLAIQGFEPLLPECWPLTEAIARLCARTLCEVSVITNGWHLEERANALGGYPGLIDSLTVSIDSARASTHDRLRGVEGSYARAITGLTAARKVFRGRLCVNSVLFAGHTEYLIGMPTLLASLDITEWAISPHLTFKDGKGEVPQNAVLKAAMQQLIAEARTHHVRVFLSDELRQTENGLVDDFYVRSLGETDAVFRLSPDGSCARNHEVLETVEGTPRWDGREPATEFLTRIFAEVDVYLPRRTRLGAMCAHATTAVYR